MTAKNDRDSSGLWIGVVLFTVVIPALFFYAVYLSPS